MVPNMQILHLLRADLIISVGVRFDDRVTGKLSEFAKDADVIHIDIDPAEIGKNVKVQIYRLWAMPKMS